MRNVTIFLTLFFVIISISTVSAEDMGTNTNSTDITPESGEIVSTDDTVTNSKESTELLEEHASNYKVGNELSINGSLKNTEGSAIANATISIDFNGVAYGDTEYVHYFSKSLTTNENGVYSYSYRLLNAGTLYYSIKFNGNDYYDSNELNRSVFIYPKGTEVTVNPIRQVATGESIEITGKLTSENTILRYTSVGILISGKAYGENEFVNISKEYVRTDENGFYTYIFKPETAGRLNICVYYPGYHNYRFNQTKVTTFVMPKSTNVIIDQVSNITLGENTIIAGKLTYGEGNPLRYTGVGLKISYIDNYKYTSNVVSCYVRTNNEGLYNYTFSPEKSGRFFIIAYYPGYHDYAFSECKEYIRVNSTDEVIIKKIYQNNDTCIIVQGQVILKEHHSKDNDFSRGYVSVRVQYEKNSYATWVNAHVYDDGIFYVYMTPFKNITPFNYYNNVQLDSGVYNIFATYSIGYAFTNEFSSSLGYFEINKTGDNIKLLRYSLDDDSLNIPGDTFKGPGKADLIINNFYTSQGSKANLIDGQIITENPYEFKGRAILAFSNEREPTETSFKYFNVNHDGTFLTIDSFPGSIGLNEITITYEDIGIYISKTIKVYLEYYSEGNFNSVRINLEKSNFENITVVNFK